MKKAFHIALAIFTGVSSVHTLASLPLEDRGATTYDPNTGLEWLDLSFTAGRSYENALQGFDSYRFATRSEVIGLFIHAGENPVNQQANLEAAARALELLGTTLPMPGSNLYRSWMNYDASTESIPTAEHIPTAVFGTGEIGGGIIGNQGFFLVPGLFPTRTYQSAEIANALVRQVPEPSAVAQGLFGLAVLAASFLCSRQNGAVGSRA